MEQPEPADGGVLEWRVWPAADRPVLSVVVALVALGFCVIASWSFQAMSYGVVGLVILFVVLSQHYLPAHYRLGETGVSSRFLGSLTVRAWDEVPYAWDCGLVIVLTAVPERSRRRHRNAVVLRLNDNHAEVIAFLSKHAQIIDKRSDKGRQLWPR